MGFNKLFTCIIMTLPFSLLIASNTDSGGQSEMDYLFETFLTSINRNELLKYYGGPFKPNDFNLVSEIVKGNQNDEVECNSIKFIPSAPALSLFRNSLVFDIYDVAGKPEKSWPIPFLNVYSNKTCIKDIIVSGKLSESEVYEIINKSPSIFLEDNAGQEGYYVHLSDKAIIEKKVFDTNDIYSIHSISQNEVQVIYYANAWSEYISGYFYTRAPEIIITRENEKYSCYRSQYIKKDSYAGLPDSVDFIYSYDFDEGSLLKVLEIANQYNNIEYLNAIVSYSSDKTDKFQHGVYALHYGNPIYKLPLFSVTMTKSSTGWEASRFICISSRNYIYIDQILNIVENAYLQRDITNESCLQIDYTGMQGKLTQSDHDMIKSLLNHLPNISEYNIKYCDDGDNKVIVTIDNELLPVIKMYKVNNQWFFDNLERPYIPTTNIDYEMVKKLRQEVLKEYILEMGESPYSIIDKNKNSSIVILSMLMTSNIEFEIYVNDTVVNNVKLDELVLTLHDLKKKNPDNSSVILLISIAKHKELVEKLLSQSGVSLNQIWINTPYGFKEIVK